MAAVCRAPRSKAISAREAKGEQDRSLELQLSQQQHSLLGTPCAIAMEAMAAAAALSAGIVGGVGSATAAAAAGASCHDRRSGRALLSLAIVCCHCAFLIAQMQGVEQEWADDDLHGKGLFRVVLSAELELIGRGLTGPSATAFYWTQCDTPPVECTTTVGCRVRCECAHTDRQQYEARAFNPIACIFFLQASHIPIFSTCSALSPPLPPCQLPPPLANQRPPA
eukprot:6176362-Pleurochrysis_carterae.AAC.2